MSDLSLLTDAAQAAGEVALPFWRRTHKSWEKAEGAGPVTEADLAVDAMLKDRLLAARPDFGWLSEESEDSGSRQSTSQVFIVDPIDGTRAFMAGERTWAHSLAISRNGTITAAVIYLPAREKLYTAKLGGGAFLNGVSIRSSSRSSLDNATVLSAKPNLNLKYWPNGLPQMHRHFRASLAYRLALIAEGRFDAMLTFRDTWEWDVAAGTLITKEAGGMVSDRFGDAPIFNNPKPVLRGLIAAGPPVHGDLLRHLLGNDSTKEGWDQPKS